MFAQLTTVLGRLAGLAEPTLAGVEEVAKQNEGLAKLLEQDNQADRLGRAFQQGLEPLVKLGQRLDEGLAKLAMEPNTQLLKDLVAVNSDIGTLPDALRDFLRSPACRLVFPAEPPRDVVDLAQRAGDRDFWRLNAHDLLRDLVSWEGSSMLRDWARVPDEHRMRMFETFNAERSRLRSDEDIEESTQEKLLRVYFNAFSEAPDRADKLLQEVAHFCLDYKPIHAHRYKKGDRIGHFVDALWPKRHDPLFNSWNIERTLALLPAAKVLCETSTYNRGWDLYPSHVSGTQVVILFQHSPKALEHILEGYKGENTWKCGISQMLGGFSQLASLMTSDDLATLARLFMLLRPECEQTTDTLVSFPGPKEDKAHTDRDAWSPSREFCPSVVPSIAPFLRYLLSQLEGSPERIKEVGGLYDRVVALAFENPELCHKLRDLPSDKIAHWRDVLSSTDRIHTLKEATAREVLERVGGAELAARIFSDDRDIERLRELVEGFCKQHEVPGKLLLQWLAIAAPRKGLDNINLPGMLKELTPEGRTLIAKMARMRETGHYGLDLLLQLARLNPHVAVAHRYFDRMRILQSEFPRREAEAILSAALAIIKLHPLMIAEVFEELREKPARLKALSQLAVALKPQDFCQLLSEHLYLKPDDDTVLTHHPQLAQGFCAFRSGTFEPFEVHRDMRLLTLLSKDNAFAAQFRKTRYWKGPDLKLLDMRLSQDPAAVQSLFELAGDHPQALTKLLPVAVARSEDDDRPLGIFYKELRRLARSTPHKIMADRLLTQLGNDDKFALTLLLPLMREGMEGTLDGVLDMLRAGARQEAEEMLSLKADDPLRQRLLSWVSSENVDTIHSVLALRRAGGHLLLRLIEQQPFGPISSFHRKLLELDRRGEGELFKVALNIGMMPLEGRTEWQKHIVNMVTDGFFVLAKSHLDHSNHPFFRSLIAVRPLAMQQLCRDLFISLEPPPSDWPEGTADKLLQQALKVARQENGGAEAVEWLGRLQFWLRQDPTFVAGTVNALGVNSIPDPSAAIDRLLIGACAEDDAAPAMLPLTLALGRCMQTRGGSINVALSRHVRNSSVFRRLAPTLPERAYIEPVLDAQSDNPEFSELLESVPARSRGPRAAQADELVRLTLGLVADAPISVEDRRTAVLSASYWMVQQSTGGSCFATGPLQARNSHKAGLLETFREMRQLAVTGRARLGKEPLEMVCDRQAFREPRNAGKHPVAVVHEYTLASVGDVGNGDSYLSFFNEAPQAWNFVIGQCLDRIAKDVPRGPDIAKLALPLLDSTLKAGMRIAYQGFAYHPDAPFEGRWEVIDRLTGEALGRYPGVHRAFLLRNLEAVSKGLLANQEDDIFVSSVKTITAKLEAEIGAERFQRAFYQKGHQNNPRSTNKGLARINPGKYSDLTVDNPFMRFEGGSEQVQKALADHPVQSTYLKRCGSMIEAVVDYVERLPRAITAKARSEPSFLVSVTGRDHDFTLQLGKVAGATREHSAREQGDRFNRQLDKLLATSLEGDLEAQLTDTFLKNYSNDEATPVSAAFQQLRGKDALKTIGDYVALMRQAVAVVTGDAREVRCAEQRLAWTLLDIKGLKDKIPKYTAVASTNWTDGIEAGYDLPLDAGRANTTLRKSDGTLHKDFWQPGALHTLSVHE